LRQLLAPLTLLIALLSAACHSLPTPTEIPAVPLPPIMSVKIGELQGAAPPAPSATLTRVPQTRMATSTVPPPTFTPIPTRIPSHDLAALSEYQRGVAYAALQNGAYHSADSDHSLDLLFATGANYISLLVTWYQNDWGSTDIQPKDNTPSDEDLAHVIKYAHEHGVHVLLKPQVDFSNDPGHWRGQVSFDNANSWQAWFDSYRQFILYYARFAQRNDVEEFSVGTELETASQQTEQWRAIIRAVRAEYTGLLTYSANHSGEEVSVAFWDDLDFIGVSNFYHLTNYRSPTIGQLMDGWTIPSLRLQWLHERFPNQPIIFTEVGYPSLERANVWPWNWYRSARIDVDAQARCYEALFRVWWKNPDRPWFRGLFIWNWLARTNQGGLQDGNYTPHGKPAENVLKAWFSESPQASPYSSIVTPRP
jgi:glycosyl hydrolase family 113